MMMSNCKFSFFCFVIAAVVVSTHAQLTPDFYDRICPSALPVIRRIVFQAIQRERRMGASLLRLHFHDCFVNGCDGSVLLDDTPTFEGEKTSSQNINSIRGFEVVDEIKSALNTACGNVVSCADILATAARDSVAILGGPSYQVLLGRRDARTASFDDANRDIPPSSYRFSQLLKNFESQGLDWRDLVALSGAHTIGFARCSVYLPRITNDTNIDPNFKALLEKDCPNPAAENNNTRPIDIATGLQFDPRYYNGLLQFKGLLHSDQELYKGDGSESDALVRLYSINPRAFWDDFVVSIIKMGNIRPLTGKDGEVRLDCRKVN